MINRTPCKVIAMRNGMQRAGRAGVAAMPPGSMLYYLWHEETGLYYIEAYADEAYAIRKAATTMGPSSMSEVKEWWRTQAKHVRHSYRTKDEES